MEQESKQDLRSKYKADLRSAIDLIEGLADQQAMTDNSYLPSLFLLKVHLEELEKQPLNVNVEPEKSIKQNLMNTLNLKSKILDRIHVLRCSGPCTGLSETHLIIELEWVLKELEKEQSKPCPHCGDWGHPNGCPACGTRCMGG